MANTAMNDLSNILGTQAPIKQAQNSTNKKAGSSLDMTDFLTLMVAMFQNQDIDNAASTTDMMNQFVQMSVVQAITNISTLIDDSTVLTYAASLVGKEVTIGEVVGKEMVETVGTVIGTGTLNGQQVIFLDNDKAVGRLPEQKEDVDPDKGEGDGDKVDGDNTGDTGTKPTEPTEPTEPGGDVAT